MSRSFFKRTWRLFQIANILTRYGLDNVLRATHRFRILLLIKLCFPWRWFQKNQLPDGVAIREALQALGPIFVKFGQVLSTRQDLFPEHIIRELSKLQDKVPPFDGQEALAIIESALEAPIDSVYQSIDATPLASASVAQVHAAVLPDGSEVVVKVLRPGVKEQIAEDVALMEMFASLAERYWPHAKRFHPMEVVNEFKMTLFDELDLMREAANAAQLKRNFAKSDLIYVPEIHWDATRQTMMTQERIFGVPINDVATLKAAGTDMKRLAEMGVEIFFTQVFRDCFFHADMHPGNIFVDISNPKSPQYMAVDFGIMGTLGPVDQRYLAENFLAFFKRDYRRVAELHVASGWVPPDTRVDEFESAIRTVCEPIFEKPLKDISFGQTLVRLFQVAQRFEMEVQPQLILLQKTLLSVEGLGRMLYPELDLWNTAKPFLERWMKEHLGARALRKKIVERFPLWVERLPDLPDAAYDVMQFWQQQTLYQRPQAQKRQQKRQVRVTPIKVLGLLVAGIGLIEFTSYMPELIFPQHGPLFSMVMVLLGIGFLMYEYPE